MAAAACRASDPHHQNHQNPQNHQDYRNLQNHQNLQQHLCVLSTTPSIPPTPPVSVRRCGFDESRPPLPLQPHSPTHPH